MNGDYHSTHEMIMKNGLEMFLDNGFVNTSLRDLCKKCNVTTGAFYKHFKDKEDLFCEIVKPVMEKIDQYFITNANRFLEASTSKKEFSDFYKLYTHEELAKLVDFIYDYFDLLELLVASSKGTRYEDFIEYMALKSDQGILCGSAKFKECGIPFEVSLEEMHILNHAYYSCLAEIIKHRYKKAEAKKYIYKIGDFFSAGYEKTIFKMD